jgi:excisionase family DNA binding protein
MTSEMEDYLLTKDQLAERLGLKRRGVECLVASRKIPVIKVSGRCVRFSWSKVLTALNKLEVKAVSTE